jgi:6-pyruvoyl-tetrahydropterin synthase
MQLRVEKTFRFEAAHRLVKGYVGGCSHLHGHTWRVSVELTLRSGQALDEYDFAFELGDLKPFKDLIATKFDHAVLLNTADPLYALLRSPGFDVAGEPHRIVAFKEANPTIEVVARELAGRAQKLFNSDRVYVSKLVVHETPYQHCTLEFAETMRSYEHLPPDAQPA